MFSSIDTRHEPNSRDIPGGIGVARGRLPAANQSGPAESRSAKDRALSYNQIDILDLEGLRAYGREQI
jgi:hypothetical protein